VNTHRPGDTAHTLTDVELLALTFTHSGHVSLVIKDWVGGDQYTISCGYVTATTAPPTDQPAPPPHWCPLCQTTVTPRWHHTGHGPPVAYHLHNRSMHAVTVTEETRP
jgi:hypothetical protein